MNNLVNPNIFPEISTNYFNIKHIASGAYGDIYSAKDSRNNEYIYIIIK